MTDEREVECQDCGYRWRSSAAEPRCAKSECGRSRNVEPVEGDTDDGLDDDADEEPSHSSASDEPDDDLDDDRGDEEQDADGDGDGFTPAFKTRSTTDGATSDDDAVPELRLGGDDDSDDSDDSDDDSDGGTDPADEVPELDPEQLGAAFGLTFDVVADQRGEHWTLDDDEAGKLGEAWAPVANEYLPHLLAEHTEVGIAVIATASILTPRLMEDKRRAEQEARQEREAANGEPGDVREPEPVEAEQDDGQAGAWPDEGGTEATAAAPGGFGNV